MGSQSNNNNHKTKDDETKKNNDGGDVGEHLHDNDDNYYGRWLASALYGLGMKRRLLGDFKGALWNHREALRLRTMHDDDDDDDDDGGEAKGGDGKHGPMTSSSNASTTATTIALIVPLEDAGPLYRTHRFF